MPVKLGDFVPDPRLLQQVGLGFLVLLLTYVALKLVRKVTVRLGNLTADFLINRSTSLDRRIHALIPERIEIPYVIRTVTTRLFQGVRILAFLFVLSVSLEILLGIVPSTRGYAEQALNAVLDPAKALGAGFLTHLPGLILVALIGFATFHLLRLVRYVFEKVDEGVISFEGFNPAWSGTTQKLTSFLIIVLAMLVAYPYIPGSESSAFKGVTLFLGILVSLGSTGLVSNLISGVMLTYMDAFRENDYVSVGEQTGFVEGTSLLTTRLRTSGGRIITIPNGMVLNTHVTNHTADGAGGAVVSRLAVAYDVPWRQAEELLRLAAARTPSVRSTPEPLVLETELGSKSIVYELHACVQPGHALNVALAELNRSILDAFNEYGISLLTPEYEGDPDRPKLVPPSEWYAAPARRADGAGRSAGMSG